MSHVCLIFSLTRFVVSQLTKYPVLINFEQRTQIPKTYAVLGASLLVVILHMFNALAAPVSNLVGWALPAYLSFKALESPSTQDDVQWLTYWVVFGFFNFLESFALRLVLYYVPWYFAFKTLFILWLQLPYFRVSLASLLPHSVSVPVRLCVVVCRPIDHLYLRHICVIAGRTSHILCSVKACPR